MLKNTKNRKLILDTINKLDSKASIDNICKTLPNIDKSTIYRTINTFLKNNIIDKNIIDDKIIYNVKNIHTHYITCIKCHKTIKIKDCHFSKIKKELEKENNVILINHNLNLEGICKECNNEM